MRHVYGWLLLTPAAILLIGFTHYPAAATLLESFFSTGTVVRPSRFVGLGNYASLAEDPIFWQGPVLAGDRLWAVNSEGQIYTVSTGEGSATLFRELEQPISLPPIVANNTLYVLDDSGRITAFR